MITLQLLLFLIAMILFLVSAFDHGGRWRVNLLSLGLACFAGAFLIELI